MDCVSWIHSPPIPVMKRQAIRNSKMVKGVNSTGSNVCIRSTSPKLLFRAHRQQCVMKSRWIQLIHWTNHFFSQFQVSNKVRNPKRFQNNRIESEGGGTLTILPPAASLNRFKGVSDGRDDGVGNLPPLWCSWIPLKVLDVIAVWLRINFVLHYPS